MGILMTVECYGESPGKFDSRTLNRKTLNRWTGRIRHLASLVDLPLKALFRCHVSMCIHIDISLSLSLSVCLSIYLSIYLSLSIYIYIERERDMSTYVSAASGKCHLECLVPTRWTLTRVYMCMCVYIYIYIYDNNNNQ